MAHTTLRRHSIRMQLQPVRLLARLSARSHSCHSRSRFLLRSPRLARHARIRHQPFSYRAIVASCRQPHFDSDAAMAASPLMYSPSSHTDDDQPLRRHQMQQTHRDTNHRKHTCRSKANATIQLDTHTWDCESCTYNSLFNFVILTQRSRLLAICDIDLPNCLQLSNSQFHCMF